MSQKVSRLQISSQLRSGVENYSEVLFDFIIHLFPIVAFCAAVRSICSRHNVLNFVHEIRGSDLCYGMMIMTQDFDILGFSSM
jgi:hypothetical protein